MTPNFGYKVFQMLRNSEVRSHRLPIIIFLTYSISEYLVHDGGRLKNIIDVTIILFCSIYIQQIIFLVIKVWKKIKVHPINDNTNGIGKHDIDKPTLSDELIT